LPRRPPGYIEAAKEFQGMASIAEAAPMVSPGRDRTRDRAVVRIWLYLVAVMIIAVVVLGGATRLTHSGLSITEWQPVHGVIPPLNDSEWQDEFAKYQQIPEYRELNQGMTLDNFKSIFWWEWAHRIVARLIGAVVLVPMVFFWATGRLEPSLKPRMVAIFLLGGLQGAVGWWMVASGLSERTDVSQYRLATHLTLACAILAYVLWVARSIAPTWRPTAPAVRFAAGLIVGLALVQIALGGLVAGLDAGLTLNTWPLMDGTLVPSGLFGKEPWWRNLFENVATVQFDHRVGAYILFALALFHAWQAKAQGAWLLAALVTVQAALGIATLLNAVPLPLGLAHQAGAVIVLSAAVIHLRRMRAPLAVTG
jgi:cytochrome c oxidase assembly protein subunit 15